jgi:Fe-S-cluster containining protein
VLIVFTMGFAAFATDPRRDGPLGPAIPLDAGDFSSWLADMRAALRGERAADVPCGDCTACCTSSQFVHIAPDETDTLAHIPAELLFPAPGMPRGHVVLGYDQRGHCPMLVDNRCSIYAHRPRTCRTYDCRIFPAAGVDPEQPLIARQAARWRFAFPTDSDRRDHQAVQAAASTAQSGKPTDVAAGAVMEAAEVRRSAGR